VLPAGMETKAAGAHAPAAFCCGIIGSAENLDTVILMIEPPGCSEFQCRCCVTARIRGELMKLGIQVSQSTVARYMPRERRPESHFRVEACVKTCESDECLPSERAFGR